MEPNLPNSPENDRFKPKDDDKDTDGTKLEDDSDDAPVERSKTGLFEVSAESDEPDKKPKSLFDAFDTGSEESTEYIEEETDEPLTPDETYTVVEEYVGARTSEVRGEVEATEPDSPEEAAALADALLLEHMRDKLAESGEGSEDTLDEALEKTISALALEEDEPPVESEDAPVAPSDVSGADETPAEVPTTEPGTSPTAEETLGDVEETADMAPPVAPPPPPPAHPVDLPAPTPEFGSIAPPDSPVAVPETTGPVEDVEPWQIRRARAGGILLGGIVGYMIGRRGGRIRTEERLLPVQKKLEKEVKSLQEAVAEREEKIRRLVYETTSAKPERAAKVIERIEKRVEQKQAARSPEAEKAVVSDESETQAFPDKKLGKFALPSAEVLPERRKITAENDGKPRVALEVMTVPQLLEVVENAKVEGVSVKQIYEAGRINEFGLRRVAIEYLRGKHFDKVLEVYILPDSGEVIKNNLSPESNKAGQSTPEAAVVSQSPQSNVPSLGAKFSQAVNLPTLRKQPKLYPSAIGMAAGVLLGLLIIIYILLKSL